MLRYQSRPAKKTRRLNKLPIIAMVCIVAAAASVVALLASNGFFPAIRFAAGSSSARASHSSAAVSGSEISQILPASSGSNEMPSDSQVSSEGSSSTAQPSSETSSSAPVSVTPTAGSLLMLVNKSNPIPDGYTPSLSTVNINYYTNSGKDNRFDSRAAPYLTKMIKAAAADGITLRIVSGYRSHAFQVSNFNAKVNQYISQGYSKDKAQAKAATIVAPPGTSEHETGLSCDIISGDWYTKNSDLTASFDKTREFQWLNTHAAEYGFILRYPLGKESVTGYTYEPWHYRFVGTANAPKIKRSGLCLEEYLQQHPAG